jgi:hypothetical protein
VTKLEQHNEGLWREMTNRAKNVTRKLERAKRNRKRGVGRFDHKGRRY